MYTYTQRNIPPKYVMRQQLSRAARHTKDRTTRTSADIQEKPAGRVALTDNRLAGRSGCQTEVVSASPTTNQPRRQVKARAAHACPCRAALGIPTQHSGCTHHSGYTMDSSSVRHHCSSPPWEPPLLLTAMGTSTAAHRHGNLHYCSPPWEQGPW